MTRQTGSEEGVVVMTSCGTSLGKGKPRMNTNNNECLALGESLLRAAAC